MLVSLDLSPKPHAIMTAVLLLTRFNIRRAETKPHKW